MSHSPSSENRRRQRTTDFTWYSGDLHVEVRWEGKDGEHSSLFLRDGPQVSVPVNGIRIFMKPKQLRNLRDAINAVLPEEVAAEGAVAWGALDPGVAYVS